MFIPNLPAVAEEMPCTDPGVLRCKGGSLQCVAVSAGRPTCPFSKCLTNNIYVRFQHLCAVGQSARRAAEFF